MTSSNGNILRVTGPLCGEFTGLRWIPRTKASDAELWYFLWFCLIKRLSKHSRGWCFETLSRPLWRHCNEEMGCNREQRPENSWNSVEHVEKYAETFLTNQKPGNGRNSVKHDQICSCLRVPQRIHQSSLRSFSWVVCPEMYTGLWTNQRPTKELWELSGAWPTLNHDCGVP